MDDRSFGRVFIFGETKFKSFLNSQDEEVPFGNCTFFEFGNPSQDVQTGKITEVVAQDLEEIMIWTWLCLFE